MIDLLDKDNKHVFLHKVDNKNNSFIANVNLLVKNLESIVNLEDLFTADDIKQLVILSKFDIKSLVEDLNRGSLYGYRKLDIDLLKNFSGYSNGLTDEEKNTLWDDPTKQVYYDSITVEFTDKTSLFKTFNQLGVNTPISNHHQLYSQLDEWVEFKAKAVHTMFNISPDTSLNNHELLRMWDGIGSSSTVEKVTLHVAAQGQNQSWDSGFVGANEYSPYYIWLGSTSVLVMVAQKINELLAVSTNVNQIVNLEKYLKELLQIHSVLDKLASNDTSSENIYKELDKLVAIYSNLDQLLNLSNSLPIIDNIYNNKANIISEVVPAGYDVTYTLSQINSSVGYVIGDVLTSGIFSYKVTKVTNEGRVIAGVLTPLVVATDLSGSYTFSSTTNITSIKLNVACIPKVSTITSKKDLIDVYNELKGRADITSSDLATVFSDIDELELYLKSIDESLGSIEAGGGLNLSLQINSFVARAGKGYYVKPPTLVDSIDMTLPKSPLVGDTIYVKGDFGSSLLAFVHGSIPINMKVLRGENLKDVMFAITFDGSQWLVTKLSETLGLLLHKPTVITPTEGAESVSPSITFKSTHFDEFESGDTPIKTRWIVKKGKNVVIDTGEIPYSTTFKPVDSLEQGVVLSVQKYDIGKYFGFTSLSNPVVFTTAVQGIVTPRITNVDNNAVGVALPLHFSTSDFEAIGMPDEYGIKSQLQLSTDSLWTSIVYDSGEVGYTTDFIVPANLTNPLTIYYVRTRQEGDTFGWSSWSTVIKIKTKDIALLPPHILVPTEGLEKVTSKPLITIDAFAVVGGTDTPSKTRIQASISPTFATILQDSGDIAYTTSHTFPDAFPKNTVIYLRAQHKGVLLGDSGYGATRSFKTADFVPSYHKFVYGGNLIVTILAACVRSDGTLTLLGMLQGNVQSVIIHYNQVSGEVIKTKFLKAVAPSQQDLYGAMVLTKNDDVLLAGYSYTTAWEGNIVFVSEDFKTVRGVRISSIPISVNIQLLAKNIDKDSFYWTGTDNMGNGYYATVLENGSIDGSITKTTGSGGYQYSMVRADDALVVAYHTKLVVLSQTHSLIKGVSHPLEGGGTVALSNSDQNGAFYYARSNSASPAQLDIYPISSNLTSSSGLNLAGAALTTPRLRLGTDNALLLSGNVSPAIGKMLVLQFKAGFSGIDKTPFAYSPMYSGETCFSKNGDVLLLSRSIVMERDFNFRGTMPCDPLASCVDSSSIVTTSIPALTLSDYSPTMTKVAPVTSPLAFDYSETPLTHVHCQLA